MKQASLFFILLFTLGVLFSSCGIYSDWCEGVANVDKKEVESL
jgi:hypothetical protein